MKTKMRFSISILFILSLLLAVGAVSIQPVFQLVNAEIETILSAYPNWYFPISEYYSLFQSGTDFGSAVSGAGNVIVDANKTQFDDVMVGAQKYRENGNPYGAVFFFQGSGAGLSKGPVLTLVSEQQGSDFGCQVAKLGDVNQDGYDDIAIGACTYNNEAITGKDEGAAYVYYGPLNRPMLEKWEFINDNANAKLGSALAGGDINDDGIGDLIIGAKNFSEGFTSNGKVFVFYGAASTESDIGGFAATPDWTAIGEEGGAQFGAAVDFAGFVNDDSYPDIVIGAPYARNAQGEQAGCVYLFHGNSSDIELDLTPAWKQCGDIDDDLLEEEIIKPQFGASVAGVGDVNGDGRDDVLVGSPYAKNELGIVTGCVYLFFGSEAGLREEPLKICGEQTSGKFGASIAAAGDMNGDLKADFLVGMPNYSVNNEKMGAVYLFFGIHQPEVENIKVENLGVEIVFGNKAETEFGMSVSSAGDVNGDSRLDVIVGAPNFKVNNLRYGRGMVYYAGIAGIPDPGDSFSIFLPLVQR